MIRGLAILLGFQVCGEGIVYLLGLPIPGSVVGMALLLGGLLRGWITLSVVEATAAVLLADLGLFFVPPAISILQYGDVIRQEWLPMGVALVGSSVLVLLTAGAVQQALERPATEESNDESCRPDMVGGPSVRGDPHPRRV
jgi:holin-like protein